MSCDNVTYCTQCKLSYIFDIDLNKCVNKSTYEDAEAKEKGATSEGNKTKEQQKNEQQSGRRKVKKKKNGSNYFSISNIIMLEIIYVIFLLIKF